MDVEKKLKVFSMALIISLILLGIFAYKIWTQSSEIAQLKSKPHTEQQAPSSFISKPWPDNWDPWSENWDPTGQFSMLRQNMDEMMNSMLPQNSFFNQLGFGFSSGSPNVEMEETDKAYKITIDVPQGQEIELNADLKDNTLKISGKIKMTDENVIDGVSSKMIRSSRFSQSIYLADEVEAGGMVIEHESDKVKVMIPKA